MDFCTAGVPETHRAGAAVLHCSSGPWRVGSLLARAARACAPNGKLRKHRPEALALRPAESPPGAA